MIRIESNSSLWEQRINASIPFIEGSVFIPSPFLFTSPVIKVFLSTVQPLSREWNFGGRIERKIFTGDGIGGAPDTRLSSRKIWVNKSQVFVFNEICEYELGIKSLYGGDGVRLFVWEYTGVI